MKAGSLIRRRPSGYGGTRGATQSGNARKRPALRSQR